MESITVFGSRGFVGSEFCTSSKYDIVEIPRTGRKPFSTDVVYFISTVDNYNVLTNSFIDIDTNLTWLMRVLDNYRTHCCKQHPECQKR